MPQSLTPSNNENQTLLSSNGNKSYSVSHGTENNMADRRVLRRRRQCVFATFWALFALSIIICIVVVFQAQSRTPVKHDALNAIRSSGKDGAGVMRGCEATVLIMRHCEKFGPSIRDSVHNQHCSYLGLERAKYIGRNLFGKRWPLPSYLYALSPTRPRHLNFREVETLLTLSEKVGLDINSNYTNNQRADLADEVFDKLRAGDLCGRVVAISWDQAALPLLARELGCGEDEGCPARYTQDSFDDVWQLKYVYGPPILYSAKEETGVRRLRRSGVKNMWFVYGSVTHMNFDPLEFSMKHGDHYTIPGTPL